MQCEHILQQNVPSMLDLPDHGTCLYAANSTDLLTYTVVSLIYILCTYK
jgi:hypothetical protein